MKKNQIVILMLLWILTFLRNQLWILPAPLMDVIVRDLAIPYSSAGMLVSIIPVLMGTSLFVGSFIIDFLGNWRALLLSGLLLVFDGIIAFGGAPYTVILVGRIMTGLGFGLSIGAMTSIISETFAPSQRSLANGMNIAFNSFSIAIAYLISVPLYALTGSWRLMMLFWSIAALAVTALTYLFYKKTITYVGGSVSTKKLAKNSIFKAIGIRDIRCYTVAMVGATLLYNSYVVYLPMLLTLVHGFSTKEAGAASSLISFIGIAGSFFIGIFPLSRKHPRSTMLILLTAVMLSSAIITQVSNRFVIYASIGVLGFCFYAWVPAAITAIMNLPTVNAHIIGGAIAVFNGTGGLLAVFIPIVFGILESNFGMQNALLGFSLLIVPSLISVFFTSKRVVSSRERNILNPLL